MDFREVQRDSRRRGLIFGAAFVLVALLWAFAVYQVFDFCLDVLFHPRPRTSIGLLHRPRPPRPQWPSRLIPTLAALAVVLGFSLARVKKIKDGGSSFIATSLGAVPLDLDSNLAGGPVRQRERMLANIVAEMAVAASIPEPDVYVLANDYGINAMAAGLDIDDSAVIVTKGALKHLSRDELAAVVAHELSHVLNGDMRRFTLMAGWLHGLFMVWMLARRRLGMPRDLRLLIGAGLLLLVGLLGWLFGRLFQAAFCRSREWLADASSVQFTRDPKALAGALKKIGGLPRMGRIRSAAASGVGHMFMVHPGLASKLSAHPPLAERIWALDPAWDGWYHDFEAEPADYFAPAPPAPGPADPGAAAAPADSGAPAAPGAPPAGPPPGR
jgi:Zn-dependent protease with chaperone function